MVGGTTAALAPSLPRTLGRYQLERVLGQGIRKDNAGSAGAL